MSTRNGNEENADGSGIVNISNDPVYDLQPAWAPDGTRIAYATVVGGSNWEIILTTTGAGKTHLTTDVGNDYDPDWQACVVMMNAAKTVTATFMSP